MLSTDLAQQVQLIELQARKILTGNLVGDYSTRLKGTGFEFDQVREYDAGDDVRFIDWKSSARTGRLLTKQYLDERNRTVMIMLDLSASNRFGARQALQAQAAALLAAVAHYGKDRVGLLLFAEQVIKYVAPNKGATHLWGLYQDIFTTLAGPGTDFNAAFDLLAQRAGRERWLLFVVSDFITDQLEQPQLRWAAQQHDLIALRCLDAQAQQLPELGLLQLTDLESGTELEVTAGQYAKINQLLQERLQAQSLLLGRLGIALLELADQAQLVPALLALFQQRLLY